SHPPPPPASSTLSLHDALPICVVKAHDFFRGLFTVDLGADEIIVSVQFNPVRSAAYAKLPQRASHFAIVGVAAALDLNKGTIRRSEEHTSELQSRGQLVCRLLL